MPQDRQSAKLRIFVDTLEAWRALVHDPSLVIDLRYELRIVFERLLDEAITEEVPDAEQRPGGWKLRRRAQFWLAEAAAFGHPSMPAPDPDVETVVELINWMHEHPVGARATETTLCPLEIKRKVVGGFLKLKTVRAMLGPRTDDDELASMLRLVMDIVACNVVAYRHPKSVDEIRGYEDEEFKAYGLDYLVWNGRALGPMLHRNSIQTNFIFFEGGAEQILADESLHTREEVLRWLEGAGKLGDFRSEWDEQF